MISNQILQTTLEGFHDIVHAELCVCDTEGKVLAHTAGMPKTGENEVQGFSLSEASSQSLGGLQYFKVYDEFEPEYIVLVSG